MWWETRLLILSAGAVRIGRPRVIVFTAIREGKAGRFAGWALPVQLRDMLITECPIYSKAFETAMGLSVAAHLDMAVDPSTGTKIVPSSSGERNLPVGVRRLVRAWRVRPTFLV